jgi:hypothetical protein
LSGRNKKCSESACRKAQHDKGNASGQRKSVKLFVDDDDSALGVVLP